MVVLPAPALAPCSPDADLAGLDGFRVVLLDQPLVPFGEFIRHRPQYHPVVGDVIGHAITFGGHRRDDVKGLRRYTLHAGEHVRIRGELEDGAALGFPRQLGVVRFVGPRSEVALFLDASQDVGVSGKPIAFEAGLDNDVGSRFHPVQRQLR